MNKKRAAFTLIELLVVVAIIGILVSMIFGLAPQFIARANQTKSMNNMRQIGNGFQIFASDNDFALPGRVKGGDKWPLAIFGYIKDKAVFADPGDPRNFLKSGKDPLSNASNNTSYIMNGYNDVPGMFEGEAPPVKVSALDKPSDTILLAMQSGSGNFFMDFMEGNNSSGVLNKSVFNKGSNYLFADGSVRFISKVDYDRGGYGDHLWLVHKDSNIPSP